MSSEDQKRLIPDNKFGKFILKIIYNLEDLFPILFARISQYPIIVLKKK